MRLIPLLNKSHATYSEFTGGVEFGMVEYMAMSILYPSKEFMVSERGRAGRGERARGAARCEGRSGGDRGRARARARARGAEDGQRLAGNGRARATVRTDGRGTGGGGRGRARAGAGESESGRGQG